MTRLIVLLLAGCATSTPATLPMTQVAGGTGGGFLPDTGGFDTSDSGRNTMPPMFGDSGNILGTGIESGWMGPIDSVFGPIPDTGSDSFWDTFGGESWGGPTGGTGWIPIPPPIDTWRVETWETGGGGPGPDTDPIDTSVSTLGPGELRDGDVAITELMLDPGCTGGTWFEIQNQTPSPIRMRDFSFTWAGVSHDIVSTGDFAPVLEVGASMTIHAAAGVDCYDAPARLMFAGDLSGPPDILTLRGENRVVARIDFSDHVFPTGQSLGLHPDTRIVDGEDDRPGYWCPQSGVLTPTTDEGTPAQVNTPCAWATEGTAPSELVPGDLMITEMLALSADCTTSINGVYLEVFNTTASPIRVPGINVEFRGQVRPVRLLDGPPLLQPGAFGTLALADIEARCPYQLSTAFDLVAPSPATTEAVVVSAGRTIIDDVGVPAAAVVSGLALQLDPSVVLTGDMAENDDPALWCAGGPVLAGAAQDRGTPGQVNDCAMPDPPPDTADTDVEPPDTDDTVIDTDDTVIDSEIDPPVDTDALIDPPDDTGKTCGCASGGGPTIWWMGALLVLVRRRR